jgi:hypothetical protein
MMKSKYLSGIILVIGCALLIGYVTVQWPKKETEIDIPVGKIKKHRFMGTGILYIQKATCISFHS